MNLFHLLLRFLFLKDITSPIVLAENNSINLSYISFYVSNFDTWGMRGSFMDSMIILWSLTAHFIYFARVWDYSFGGLVMVPITTLFSTRIKFVLLFHARKFDEPTKFLLSMQNEVILMAYCVINIKVVTCKVKILLDYNIFNLMSSWFDDDVYNRIYLPSKVILQRGRDLLDSLMMTKMPLLTSIGCRDFKNIQCLDFLWMEVGSLRSSLMMMCELPNNASSEKPSFW